ncbi:Piso0_005588 [Millerozyma farinosa CBS 7064]|uniref:Piso0_005588 protein n=1 Tax=Pichia sorbitophila (strain ATCC MYA-4447 / BCRC 22081 / CBS 7064 / NBRC 10061 / NRRL Y-12695) TaxID=559304 RepID=G8Y2D5_PICSO|nr:Piso0_005588 [Millerozyma farinosa CBS 7064]
MTEAKNSGLSKRNRVPLSCLVCKRRKVKCDKVKPACGGCVKNGAAHLCTYLEPSWGKDLPRGQGIVESGVEETEQGGASRELDELRRFKSHYEEIMKQQGDTIDDLRRQITVVEQLRPKGDTKETDEVVILRKFRSLEKQLLKIKRDSVLSVENDTARKDMFVDIYSWSSIVKIDPQLTMLWYKLSNMQKMYHMFKMQNMKASSKQEGDQMQRKRQRLKKVGHIISEIDFTYSSGAETVPSSKSSKCPVVDCDFNYLTSKALSKPSPQQETQSTLPQKSLPELKVYVNGKGEIVKCNFMESMALDILVDQQALWRSTLGLINTSSFMDYEQVKFLIDFFFSDVNPSYTKDLLALYKTQIISTIYATDEGKAALSGFKNQGTDRERFHRLQSQGLSLCLLSMIVQDSLSLFRKNDAISFVNENGKDYHSLFGAELAHTTFFQKERQVLLQVENYLPIFESTDTACSLMFIACCLYLLNRQIALSREIGSEFRTSFQRVFNILARILCNENRSMSIWTDPTSVVADAAHGESTNIEDIRIHVCVAWADTIRMANASINYVLPSMDGSIAKDAGDCLMRFLPKILDGEIPKKEIAYIRGRKQRDSKALQTFLQGYYTVIKTHVLLQKGVQSEGRNTMTVADLENLQRECSRSLETVEGLAAPSVMDGSGTTGPDPYNKLHFERAVRVYELRGGLIFHQFYLSYLLLLHYEGKAEQVTRAQVGHRYRNVIRCAAHIAQFIQEGCETYSNNYHVSLVNVELAHRILQPSIGLILRLADQQHSGDLDLEPVARELGVVLDGLEPVRMLLKRRITEVVSMTITAMWNGAAPDRPRVSKIRRLWDFYINFLKHSHSFDASAFARLHSRHFGTGSATPSDCPALSHPGARQVTPSRSPTADQDTKPPPASCPINHLVLDAGSGKTIDADSSAPASAPASDSAQPGAGPERGTKRRCPFDHGSSVISREGSESRAYAAKESNVRSSRSAVPGPSATEEPAPVSSDSANAVRAIPDDSSTASWSASLDGLLPSDVFGSLDLDLDFDLTTLDFDLPPVDAASWEDILPSAAFS